MHLAVNFMNRSDVVDRVVDLVDADPYDADVDVDLVDVDLVGVFGPRLN